MLDETLANIAVCDPAVGSGAFPVGMMTEVIRARCALTPYFNDVYERTPYHFKRHAIQDCLYGVDIDAGAVEIAKLRLWLSLVVDEEETKQIKPLPNLDFKIVTGNSLLGFPFKSKGLHEIEQLKAHFFEETDHERKAKLKTEIDRTLRSCFADSKKSLGYEVNFDFKINFSEVFSAKGGFDVVVANPPYGLLNKRQNRHKSVVVSDQELQHYKSSPEYAPARGGMINIFRLFIVRSVNILREAGCLAEIFPLAFTCDSSATHLRKHLLENHRIIGIEAFPERDNERKRVFEAVKMSVCILILQARRRLTSPFWLRIHRDRYVDTTNSKVQLGIDTIKLIDKTNYTIPLLQTDELDLLESIYRTATTLACFGHCYTGEIDLTQDKRYLTEDRHQSVLLKGAIIDRYQIRLTMSQGEILFLNSKKYLDSNHGERTEHHKLHRIVMQGITGVNEKVRLKMTLTEPGTFCANSVNYIVLNDSEFEPEYLLALLNSSLLNFVFSKTSTNSNVNGYEVDNLPIKVADRHLQRSIAELARKILNQKREKSNRDTTALDTELDASIFSLYGLTEKQAELVKRGAVKAIPAPPLERPT